MEEGEYVSPPSPTPSRPCFSHRRIDVRVALQDSFAVKQCQFLPRYVSIVSSLMIGLLPDGMRLWVGGRRPRKRRCRGRRPSRPPSGRNAPTRRSPSWASERRRTNDRACNERSIPRVIAHRWRCLVTGGLGREVLMLNLWLWLGAWRRPAPTLEQHHALEHALAATWHHRSLAPGDHP